MAMPAGTVVITDDDADDRELMRVALNEVDQSIEIRQCEDGDELLALLDTLTPRRRDDGPVLVLLDLDMPRKTGLETLAELRNDVRARVLPVVVVSTSVAEIDVEAAYGHGAHAYINKPNTVVAMRRIARVLLEYWFSVVIPPLQ